MAETTIRPARPEDADTLLRGLRQCDRREAEATVGAANVEAAMHASLESSLVAWAAEVDGELAAVFGVAALSVLNGIGVPWMMGTDLLDRMPRAVIENTRAYIPRMLVLFPHLTNFVDARNQRSIRLLRWLGFEIRPAEPFGAQGLPFHRFEMRG